LPVLHTASEDRTFFGGLIDRARVWVAEEAGAIVALLVLNGDFVDHLYVAPTHQGLGVGSRLLELAKTESGGHLLLYAFERNQRARSFYEKRGFAAIEFGDGSGNEEGMPDVLYEWSGIATPPK
jgi:GNAT superfamily N-acetyltransferase